MAMPFPHPATQAMLVIAAALSTGCAAGLLMPFPFPTDYLEPTAGEGVTGEMVRPPQGASPVIFRQRRNPNALYLVRNDVGIVVHASRDCMTGLIWDRLTRDGFTVYVEFQVPEGRKLEIAEPMIGVSTGDAAGQVQAMLRPAPGHPQSGSLTGSTRQRDGPSGKDVVHKQYPTFAQLSLPKAESYRVILPMIRVNGIESRLPEVTFTRKSSLGGGVLNACWW